jgi:hypothetical protein
MTADQGPDRIIRETCITLILLETLLQLKLIALKSLSSTATVWRNCACECYSVIRAETDRMMGAAKSQPGV